MAADTVERTQVGFCVPSSIPLGKNHNADPSLHVNQLQFNLHAPYSLNSLASNFTKPQPLVIEKFPVFPTSVPSVRSEVGHTTSVPSSPASSVSSQRLHVAVQLAKIDAKKLWRQQKEVEESETLKEIKSEIKQDKRTVKTTEIKGMRKMMQDGKKPNVAYLRHKSSKDPDVRRVHERDVFPDSQENVAEEKQNPGTEEKQTHEIRRLERQIQNYLQRLDGLIHKGQEVIQKKDKRFHERRNDKDDVSHLSDEDTDPRQYERAEEQATRSARILYMIERQIRELDDEIRKKGRNMKQSKKSQTLGRLAAAQRATVRALRMFINSAPLQPKRSQHYPSIYQALTSLIQQLSLLAIQIEGGDVDENTRVQNARFDVPLKKRGEERGVTQERFGLLTPKAKLNGRHAFSQEAEKEFHRYPSSAQGSRSTYRPTMQGTFPDVDDSMLTVDPTPERNATLKAGLEALLRAKETEKRNTKPAIYPANTKKKSLLLTPALQAKRRKAHAAVQKTVKFPSDTAHFTKETTASRLKKVEKQKTTTKEEMQGHKKDEANVDRTVLPGKSDTRALTERSRGVDHELPEREIERQLWLEDESRKKLREVMEIPKSLVSEAEEAIKKKLKPILDQAQAVVDSSKAKPVQARFANIASDVTMKKNEVLSEMILDDLLIDTAQEFQRLETNEEIDESFLQDNSTLENILQRLEQFEKEEESIRRHLNHVSYTDTYGTKQKSDIKKSDREKKETIFTKSITESNPASRPSHLNHTSRTSTVFKPADKHPVSLSLPSKVRDNIFSYREKYSEYLNQANADNHGTFNPWQFVERLSDEILEEIIVDVATELTCACDDVTEMIFKSEFMKEGSFQN